VGRLTLAFNHLKPGCRHRSLGGGDFSFAGADRACWALRGWKRDARTGFGLSETVSELAGWTFGGALGTNGQPVSFNRKIGHLWRFRRPGGPHRHLLSAKERWRNSASTGFSSCPWAQSRSKPGRQAGKRMPSGANLLAPRAAGQDELRSG